MGGFSGIGRCYWLIGRRRQEDGIGIMGILCILGGGEEQGGLGGGEEERIGVFFI